MRAAQWLVAAALLAAVAPAWVAGQQPGQQPPPNIPQQYPNNPNARRVNRDSIRADSVRKLYASDSIKHTVHWVEADSMTNLLLDKDGYSHTRYQGRQAHLDAESHELQIEGERGINVGRAAVDRDTTLIIGNNIKYNDSTQRVYAKGDTIVLHDPTSNESDVFSFNSLTYDVGTHTAVVTSVSTDYTQSGQRWFIQAEKAAYQGDTVKGPKGGHNIFYGRYGDITTCDDSFPHYHIRGGELKYVSKQVLVIRPAVLYIADVPILWLPFMFQDLRRGRRSGILTPRFGFTELLRNSPTYRRHVENVGYYFVMGQYADFTTWLDWRSGARADIGDPGFTQYNGEFRYRWLDRFLDGDLAANYRTQQDGSTNTAIYWNHRQDFSLHSHLQLNINYVTSTVVQQNSYLNPYAALANINSQLNYQQDVGPASMSLGGTQTQYPGQTRLDRTFPTLSITSKPVSAGTWLTWSPSFSATNAQSYGLDQPGDFAYTYGVTQEGQLDSTLANRDTRNSSASFDTPLKIFGFNWRNSFRVRDQYNNYPVNDVIYVPTVIHGRDTTVSTTRTYRTSYATALDWDTGIDLPSLLQGSWNIVPSVSVVNADGQAPFLQRTELSGDSWVSQGKNLVYGLSVSPTFFGLFPGILGISRFRHSITTTLTFDYASAAHTSTAFLLANGQNPIGYLGNLAQESATLGLSTNIEAKFRDGPDTAPDNGTKIKLLSLNFDPITWDFARAAATHHTGLTNTSFGYDVRTDLIPGLDFRESYSLFQGNPESDTAVFKPFLTSISASVSFGANSHILDPFKKLLGIKVDQKKADSLAGRDPFFQQQAQAGHVAGQGAQYSQYSIPTIGSSGWNVSLTFTENQQRPLVGDTAGAIAYNPAQICAQFQATNPTLYAVCVYQKQHSIASSDTSLISSGYNCTTQACPPVVVPPQSSLAASLAFSLTPRWSAQWQTTYDFTRHNFASQVVTLQRDLHDWKAVFSFTQSPTGSFGFTFFVALKAEPALKFNYDRTSYRAPPGSGF
ncbi:MAG TPA: hypothetical protein VNV25_11015 [Gemmatimonadaceae bacterium]|nr:hypothetical protein [Gemmatimonadaceae bacterium]